ncbi:MAG: hypothetical protein H0V25_07200, partial [Solirubrobacterales bacterium]|nr:hypothetical protein [Solirubrobacterales bacterium]
MPIPGGIPLRFIGWLFASLLVMVMLRSGSNIVMLLVIVIAGLIGRRRDGWPGAAVGAVMGWAGFTVLSFALSLIGPIVAFFVIPFALTMFSLTAQPDGRPPHRFALAYIGWQLAPRRTDGHTGVAAVGEMRSFRASECYVAPDFCSPVLRAGIFTGEGEITFDRGARIRRLRRLPLVRPTTRYLVRSADSRLWRSQVVGSLTLEQGDQAEVR